MIMRSNPYNLTIILSYITTIMYLIWSISIVKEDMETGKIKNIKIMQGIKIIGIIIFVHIINTVSGNLGYSKSYMNLSFYKFYFINILYSLISSYILWYGEIWPAGDAKFFIISLLFIPLCKYDIYGFPSYLWLISMINIFIIAAVYSIYNYLKDNFSNIKNEQIAFKEIKDFHTDRIKNKNILNINNMFKIFSIFSIFLGKQFLNMIMFRYIFNIFHRTDIFFFILFFLWPKISKFLNTKIWRYTLATIYIIIIIYSLYMTDISSYFIKKIFLTSISNTVMFGGIFFIAKVIFEYILEKHNTYYAGTDEIKEGMILSSKELEIAKKNELFKGMFDDAFKDGLTKEQAEVLKEWLKNHPYKNAKLEFVKAKPFALSIFIGIIFCLVFSKNIMLYLKNLIK